MATFSDLYPQYYTDEYQNTGVVPAELSTHPAPAPDLIGQSALRNAPMMQPQQSQALRFEDISPRPDTSTMGGAVMNFLRGGNSVRDWGLQKQAYDTRQAANASNLATTEANLYKAIQATEPGQRQPLVKTLQRFYANQGTQMEPAVADFLNKAEQDDLAIAQNVVKLIAAQFPEANQADIGKYINSNPAGVAKFFELFARLKKERAEGALKEQEAKFMESAPKMMERFSSGQGTPGGIQTTPPPMTQPMAPQGPTGAPKLQPMAFHGTPEEKSVHQQIDSIGTQLGASQNVKDLARVVARLETANYDPQAESPAGAQGVMQLMPETQKRHRVTQPFDRGQSITGGIKELMALEKQYDSDPAAILAHYNASPQAVAGPVTTWPAETQRYVQNGLQLLGGKPISQAILSAPPEYQQRIAQLNQEIQQNRGQLAAMAGFSINPHGKAILDFLDKQTQAKERERDALIAQFKPQASDPTVLAATELGFPPTPAQWNPAQAEAVRKRAADIVAEQGGKVAKEEEASKIRVSASQGENAELVKGLNDAERKDLRILDPATGDSTPVPAHWNRKRLQEAAATGQQIVNMPPVSGSEAVSYKQLAASAAAVDSIVPLLDKPAVSKEIGNIFSNPQAWLDRMQARTGKDMDPDVYKLRSYLSRLAATLQRYYAGTAQTATELKTLDPFMVHIEDPTVLQVRSKLEALREGIGREYNSNRDFDTKNMVYVPKLGEPPTRQPTQQTQKAAQSAPAPEPETSPNPSPKAPNPIQQAIDAHNRKKR